jgi:hypothetical protein
MDHHNIVVAGACVLIIMCTGKQCVRTGGWCSKLSPVRLELGHGVGRVDTRSSATNSSVWCHRPVLHLCNEQSTALGEVILSTYWAALSELILAVNEIFHWTWDD